MGADQKIKNEARAGGDDDTPMVDAKPAYKSWKKKYRKMRLRFDEKMHESEELHKEEQKALETAKRLAIEVDRLLDLLLDINDSPQIPLDKRIELNLGEPNDGVERPLKSFNSLLAEAPHEPFSAMADRVPELLEDLQPKNSDVYPTSFLTAEDIDDYLHDLDSVLDLPEKPKVAPAAGAQPKATQTSFAATYALRNPTSVYNWLRKNAPKTFLQDLEKEKAKDADKDKDRDREESEPRKGASRSRKSGAGASRSKRASGISKQESKDWDDDMSVDAPTENSRGKRKRDDDPGYRPKGGSSRPAKKRKSQGEGGGTSRRKSKAETGAIAE